MCASVCHYFMMSGTKESANKIIKGKYIGAMIKLSQNAKTLPANGKEFTWALLAMLVTFIMSAPVSNYFESSELFPNFPKLTLP